MNVEALIKNGTAEHIVELLLEEAGYSTIRIAREGLLNGVLRSLTKNLNQSQAAGKIMTAPSLAVFEKNGRSATLVKIKFRTSKRTGRNISHGVKQLIEYWPEALLIIVTPQKPCFRVVQEANGNEKELDEVFKTVKKAEISRYEKVVEKFLGNG